jgi:hypothetical protein
MKAKEKWCAIVKLLVQKVNEYKARARQLELIPEAAKHAKGRRFEIKLDVDKAADTVVNMMGGVDMVGRVEPHVIKLVKNYESETVEEKKKIAVIKNLIKAKDIEVSSSLVICTASELVVHLSHHSSSPSLCCHHRPIQTIKQSISSSKKECESTKQKMEANIQGTCRQLELLNNRISSLSNPRGIEATIKKNNAKYERLQVREQEEKKEQMTLMKAETDEIRRALINLGKGE